MKTLTTWFHRYFGVLALVLLCNACILCPPPPSKYTAIHQYTITGDVTTVSAILSTNIAALNATDDSGATPLHLAALNCRTNVLALLLEKGAKVNVKEKRGATPLHFAAQRGCVPAIEMLLDKGAKLNPKDDEGRTPRARAEKWHRSEAAEVLKARGGLD